MNNRFLIKQKRISKGRSDKRNNTQREEQHDQQRKEPFFLDVISSSF